MKTYPLYRADGSLHAFEFSNVWLWIGTLRGILKAVPDVSNVQRVFRGENRVSFHLRGEPFVVWEPFGDNPRYWIGPVDAKNSKADLMQLHQAFLAYQYPITRLFRRNRVQRAG